MEVSREEGDVEGRNHAGGAVGGDSGLGGRDSDGCWGAGVSEVYLEGASEYQEGPAEEEA